MLKYVPYVSLDLTVEEVDDLVRNKQGICVSCREKTTEKIPLYATQKECKVCSQAGVVGANIAMLNVLEDILQEVRYEDLS